MRILLAVAFGVLPALALLTSACNRGGVTGSSSGCSLGSAECLCNSDRDCPLGDGSARFICRQGECTAVPCRNGEAGCACHGNNTCGDGKRCAGEQCAYCDAGSRGCSCSVGGACVPGLVCLAGACVAEPSEVSVIPDQPSCFTPCTGSYTNAATGVTVSCPADGLMPGCFAGSTCIDGSCTPVGQDPSQVGNCASDIDCPSHQACIDQRCYSNCDYDSDCVDGAACYQHACRIPCLADAGEDACPFTQSCVTTDGAYGYCLPLAEPEGPPIVQVDGDFTVHPSFLEFSNIKTGGRFTITNNAPVAREFRVRKVEHTQYPDSGAVTYTGGGALTWVSLGAGTDTPSLVQELSIIVGGDGGNVEIQLAGASVSAIPRWDGALEVFNAELGARRVRLEYVRRPEARWAGTMYFFSNFSDAGLDAWIESGRSASGTSNVSNAFIQKWGSFKAAQAGAQSLASFQAMLQSTLTGSWASQSVADLCKGGDPSATVACYPFENADGYETFSSDLGSVPIPSGVTEMPIAMNLGLADPLLPQDLAGRIDSSASLQYAGDPKVRLSFDANPSGCLPAVTGICLRPVVSFAADLRVGGRYRVAEGSTTCLASPQGYDLAAVPWLVPGFEEGTAIDSKTGLRYFRECRDTTLPFAAGAGMAALNRTLAGSNPIPDGRPRVRHLELVDGLLVNQSTLYILFRDRFEQFLGAEDNSFSAYGIMELRRGDANLAPEDLVGNDHLDSRPQAQSRLGVACDAELVAEVLGSSYNDGIAPDGMDAVLLATATALNDLARGVVTGRTQESTSNTLCFVAGVPTGCAITNKSVHYYCEDTGFFNGGPGDDGTPGAERVECPVGSKVTYFVLDGSCTALGCQGIDGSDSDLTDGKEVAALPCQRQVDLATGRGACLEQLNVWKANQVNASYLPRLVVDPVWRCETSTSVYCDADRANLRSGKVFYDPATAVTAKFEPLDAAVDSAFRYKTRFRSRSGSSVGFAPTICIPDSDQIPYCYDPTTIEEIQKRVDCATYLYTTFGKNPLYASTPPADLRLWNDSTTDNDVRTLVRRYLIKNFSEEWFPDKLTGVSYDGFERLYAELLIMLGDEAYTDAFAARFDLAGSMRRSFEGSKFEPNGIDLAGGAGFEMHSLYEAMQYYQLVLDRFYSLAPMVWTALSPAELSPGTTTFITQETVVTYWDRVIRASTQKARASSEIAERYQYFNRPDLARLVIERAYTATYLESVAISRLMNRVAKVLGEQKRAQIVKQLDLASKGYKAALLAMRGRYQSISDNLSYFGYEPDYIPLPVLYPGDPPNAFLKLLNITKQKLVTAADKEERALANDRSYETDMATFQSELTRIRNTYEGRLADICGTFVGDTDRQVYPAIPRYAYLNERAQLLGNPCGLMGNGLLHNGMGGFEIAGLDFALVQQKGADVLSEIQIETETVADLCNIIDGMAAYQWTVQGEVNNLQALVLDTQNAMARTDRILSRTLSMGQIIGGITAGTSGTIGTAAGMALGFAGSLLAETQHMAGDATIEDAQAEIGDLQSNAARWITEQECDKAQLTSNAKVKTLALQLASIRLESLRAIYSLRLSLAEIEKLRNEAQRIMAEQEETEQLTINVEAARNNPNVRIYKNDAVINADRTFKDAVRYAYLTTRVFEYYTSQSYARLDNLFLVRMVASGDITLEAYLAEIENDFFTFEDIFRAPDLRVAVVSLRDDIFAIPKLRDDGASVPEVERIRTFREKFASSRLLDPYGVRVVQFPTGFGRLPPRTRVHKISHIEAEISGTDVGDAVGRIELRQRGTGVVQSILDDKLYYTFGQPSAAVDSLLNGQSFNQRNAVIDTYFNSVKVYEPAVYKSEQHRDRPFVNTLWEIGFDQRGDWDNQDINLGSLCDVRLYFYYTDFTP